MISTQVVVIGLADKKEGFPFYGKGYPPPRDSYSSSSRAEHQGVVAVERLDLIEGEAGADIKNKQLWTKIPVQKKQTKVEPVLS